MVQVVRKSNTRSGLRGAWPALVAACLIAEAAGFVAIHQSMHEYRSPAAVFSSHSGQR